MLPIQITPSGRIIAPFGDPASSVPVQNRPLALWQEEMVRDADLVRAMDPAPPYVQVPDNLFATGDALRYFVEGAAGRDAVLVLKDSLHARRTSPVQPGVTLTDAGYRFEAVRYVSGRGEPPTDVVIDPDEKVIEIALPARFTQGGKLELSLARRPVMTIHHWIHILWANQAAGGLEARASRPFATAARVAWAALRSLSLNKWKVLGKLSHIGRRCDIHPTALVEGSRLGDGVTVGPYARVLFSTVGDGAVIMSGAQVEASTLGARSVVCQGTTLRLSVLYEEAIAGQALMQMCVLGRAAVTTYGTCSIDLNFDREIRVPLDGALHGTGTRFLGSAYGHGCQIGTGLWIASGRMIPNGCRLVRRAADVVSRIDPDLPTGVAIANDGGTLRPA